jgi:ABC-type lipoprotein release transport system permease subunit
MNPLSAWTFYRRHKRRAALLLGLTSLVTAGLYLMVALSWAIFVEPMRSNRMFLTKFSMAMPDSASGVGPAVVARIRANPDVAQVIPVVFGQGISLPEVMGGGTNWFNLHGVREEALAYVLERCSATVKEGQMLQPRTNGIMLSEQLAANLGLQVGDIIHNSISPLYSNIVDPMQVVGILESKVRLGIISYEYMSSHELYRIFPIRFLVVARDGRESAVNDFLRNEIQTTRTTVWTFQKLTEQVAREYQATYSLIVPIITIVAIAISLVIGVVNRIAITRRLPEFGLLHATGHSKRWLTHRLTMETGVLAAVGWVVGIGLAWLALYVLKLTVFAPRGHDLDVITLTPGMLVTPVPISVIGFALISVGRIFARLDAVAVVERGELSLEENQQRGATASKSSPKPLASATFYRRHKRQAVLLTGAMALMIVAVALFIFLLTATQDAQSARLGNLSRMSIVSSRPGSPIAPGVATQLRTHPTVERVIPVRPMTMLNIVIPPFGGANINPYSVYAEDLAYLVELYDLKLAEGHLPRPRTNEMVIPQAVAQNRGLEVGDVIGNPDRPAYPGAQALPTEFVISGILATSEKENWLSFISLEFLESHESFNISDDYIGQLIVVPRAGQKAALDDWLENELAGGEVHVQTYRQALASAQRATRSQLLAIALLESVIAIVAAVALAVLNHISVSQRQSEFGLLHALGYGRPRLVWRTVRETAFTTGTAWGLSAILCMMGLLYLQFGVFAPLGLSLDLLNLTPWLFILPIPVAVLVATGGTVARTLSKLDPISIIERRA